MKSKILCIIFFLALCFLGLWFFNHKPEEDPIALRQDINSQGASAGSRLKERDAKTIRKSKDKTGAVQKTKTFWEKQVYPERLKVADVNIPIVFEGEISEDLKQVILSDLHMIYAHKLSHNFYNLHEKKIFKTVGLEADRVISFEGNSLRNTVPKQYRQKFGRVAKSTQVDVIVFPKELIADYELAWAERNKDPQKYERLETFIGWLNTASMEELKKDNPYWLYGHDGVSDEDPELASEIRNQLLGDERSNLKFRHPSILEFTYVDQETLVKEKAEGKLPVGVTLADGHYLDENDIPIQQALFLYDGNKWHISFAPPGT